MSGFLPPILLIEGTCLNFAVSFVIVLAVFFVSLIMHAYRANIIYYYICFSEAFFFVPQKLQKLQKFYLNPPRVKFIPASRRIFSILMTRGCTTRVRDAPPSYFRLCHLGHRVCFRKDYWPRGTFAKFRPVRQLRSTLRPRESFELRRSGIV